MPISYPDRVELANIPTPLQHLARTSEHLGVEVFIKRDDLTGSGLSGNKVRKLEFLMAEARELSADTVITCGGEQSNHCRATALAAAKLGMSSLLLLRTKDPQNPPALTGNILLDRLVGAEIVWISHEDYRRRGELFIEHAARLRREGKNPYVVPEGGSNARGAWGYVRCMEELTDQLPGDASTTVVHACGSGGTSAGLLLGARMLNLNPEQWRLAAINVCDDAAYFETVINRIIGNFPEATGEFNQADDHLEIVDGYVGRGYAKSQPEELTCLRDLARREAIVLDPVYSGKAFFGMTQQLAASPDRFGSRIVFLHTGGIFGLFPAADQLAPLL